MNLLRESMTKLVTTGFTVRVWRQEELDGEINNADLWNAVDATVGVRKADAIAQIFINLPRVNAVEVLNSLQEGVIFYKDWP